MKFDLYYRRNKDSMYQMAQLRLYNGEDTLNETINNMSKDQLSEVIKDYSEFKKFVLDNEKALIDFIAMLNRESRGALKLLYEVYTYLHLEKGCLAFNLDTHQLRVVEDVNIHTVVVTLKEGELAEWGRGVCLPVDCSVENNGGMESMDFLKYGL